MKCPNCGAKIDELTEICPKCKINLDEYEEEEEEESTSKTTLLKVINGLQLTFSIITAIIYLVMGRGGLSIIIIAASIVSFAFIKGFTNIIDLLTEINEKLD